MAGLVTQPTNRPIEGFIQSINNASKQSDSRVLVKLMEEITGQKAVVWGNEKVPDFLIGFGEYTYTRKGGKEEFTWFPVGFAARKTKMTIYLNFDVSQETDLLKELGKCTFGKGCLYLNKLADVNIEVLKKLIAKSTTP
ncbi:DUF1801 domain-containing protein [Cryomorphaceae bacterium]|nr:DUF1801 domain-containing protein [Cryomorphaceae bacterium]